MKPTEAFAEAEENFQSYLDLASKSEDVTVTEIRSLAVLTKGREVKGVLIWESYEPRWWPSGYVNWRDEIHFRGARAIEEFEDAAGRPFSEEMTLSDL